MVQNMSETGNFTRLGSLTAWMVLSVREKELWRTTWFSLWSVTGHWETYRQRVPIVSTAY